MNKKATIIIKKLSALLLCISLWGFNVPDNKKEKLSYSDPVPTELKIKMKAGETHHYSISLNAGEFAQITAAQYNIDIMVKVFSAGGEYSEMFDSPTGEFGAEDIYLEGGGTGRKYEIEIYPAQKYADPGEYSISIIRLGEETDADKKWMAALAATQKADKLRAKADTRLQSIQQYEQAAAEWMALKDTVQYEI